MSASRIFALILTAVFATAVDSVSAQTLGEVARKEQERRKESKPSAKVYTNKDLGPGGTAAAPPPAPAEGAQATPGAAPETKKAETDKEDPTKTEDYWRDRMAAATAELDRNEVLLEALQSRVNALATDFVNRDDPAQRAVIANNRQRALEEMAVTRDKVQKLKQQIADIEEEARKAGVPPGWLR
jgi:hypothetical protein